MLSCDILIEETGELLEESEGNDIIMSVLNTFKGKDQSIYAAEFILNEAIKELRRNARIR